jgi:hypothetical protein
MKIEKQRLYERQKLKLSKNNSPLTLQQIDEAEQLFSEDQNNYKLRPHKITCKKDKKRKSITIPNTQYRILYSDYGDKAIFQQILSHEDYDRINKNC